METDVAGSGGALGMFSRGVFNVAVFVANFPTIFVVFGILVFSYIFHGNRGCRQWCVLGCSGEVYVTLLYLLPISQLYLLYLVFLYFLIFSMETEVAGSGGALGCSGEVYLTWTHFKVESDELSRHHHHHHRHQQYGVFALDSLQS